MAEKLEDEIIWRRNWKPEFETEAWKLIKADGKTVWIKCLFERVLCSYTFAITNHEHVWVERIDDETAFYEKAKKLNPNIEARSTYLINHLADCLISGTNFSIQKPDDTSDFVLCLKTTLPAGIPFSWEFHCSLGEKKMMKEHVVLPLLSMVGELQRRQEELFKILNRKDYEIQEYRNTGAILSRLSFETQVFEKDDFTKRMTVSEGFLQVVENCAAKVCAEEAQELYKQVMIKRKWLEFRSNPVDPKEGTFETVEDSQGFGLNSLSGTAPSSWNAELPPSLLNGTSPGKHSPFSSPSRNANKASEEKDLAEERRENLRKRLAQEAEKKKSKKPKKLKI